MRDTIFVTGFACVVGAAFMVAIPLGLVALGGPLMALSAWKSSKQKGSGT